MADSSPKIVVAGDVSIDWLSIPVEARERSAGDDVGPLNWELTDGTHMVARRGGALLLRRFVEAAADATVIGQELEGGDAELGKIECISPDALIHSIVELDVFPRLQERGDGDLVYRVARYRGFAGPGGRAPRLLPVTDDISDADVVILDDAGNGYRDREGGWPRSLRARETMAGMPEPQAATADPEPAREKETSGQDPASRPIVVLKMSRPLVEGPLWDRVRRDHAERTIVVIGADDLRADNIAVSRRLSWERTATDLAWQIASHPRLTSLANCAHVVVRFGIDGALHYRGLERPPAFDLYYDPDVDEGGFADCCPGRMLGFTAAFVAALAGRLVREDPNGRLSAGAVGVGVREGILASRRLYRTGFGSVGGDGKEPEFEELDYPGAELFQPTVEEQDVGHDVGRVALVRVPAPTSATSADPDGWCILDELRRSRPDEDDRGVSLEEVAYEFVETGRLVGLGEIEVPVGRFGALETVDRTEIESLRSIRNLVREYLETKSVRRPLSIAVFGPPGSGKSFGVTQVAESVEPELIASLPVEFNVSQFGSPRDLISAFHMVRDVALGGRIPLVFFDEFDTDFEGAELGWLKYFLAPMQDGKFKDGDSFHPIGKAIFVFAGGTRSTFRGFSREELREETGYEDFRNAKGPDFVSRLRGHVDIRGPNPVDGSDELYPIRRAMVLRSLFKRNAPELFDARGRVQIDHGVLRALIRAPGYRHGVRSMEAVLDMSHTAGRKQFGPSELPPPEQLDAHVDAVAFTRLVSRDVLFGAARERIARAIHEKFVRERKKEGTRAQDDPAMLPWDELNADLEEANLDQADHIPAKLRAVGCGFEPVAGDSGERVEFTEREIEILAEMEHDRWVAERRRSGWSYGPVKDHEKKTTPYLVPWDDLEEEIKEYDRDTVRGIPEFMAEAGFRVYRLEDR